MEANPYAAPSARPARLPMRTSWSLWGMTSRFRVAGAEVEAETGHWSGLEVYRVDGVEVLRVRNLGWHGKQVLRVEGHDVEVESRWYPLLPVVVRVDGVQRIDRLFPQSRWIKLGLAAVVTAISAVVAVGWWWTAVDLYRLWVAWR